MFNIWGILGLVSLVLLIKYFRSKNAVWGGLGLGIIAGLLISVITHDWGNFKKAAIIGTLVGGLSEMLGLLGDKFIKRY